MTQTYLQTKNLQKKSSTEQDGCLICIENRTTTQELCARSQDMGPLEHMSLLLKL